MEWKDILSAKEERGLTWDQLSHRAGYRPNTVRNAVWGCGTRSGRLWATLMDVLGLNEEMPEDTPPPRRARTTPAKTEPKTSSPWTELKRHEFQPGKKYEIRGGTKLKFLRKEGIHHVFQGPGGWLETWTDAQLAGVEVKKA